MLSQSKLFTSGHANHHLNQILTSHQLSHRMLHLQSGVHLQKVKIHIGIGNKLHRARRLIVHGSGQRTALLAHLVAGSFIEKWRRRLFNHLLVTALNGALPLTQINHIAVAIGHNLNLNMPRLLNIFFNKNAGIAKAGAGLIGGTLKAIAAVSLVPGHAHAFTATTGRGFEHHRVANTIADLHRMVGIAHHICVTANTANPGFFSNQFRGDFIAHRLNGFFARANKDNPRIVQRVAKLAVFREKTIARMHRICACVFAGLNNLINHQIALRRSRRAYAHSLIGHLHMQGICIRIGIHCHGGNAHSFGRGKHPAGNFTAVGY